MRFEIKNVGIEQMVANQTKLRFKLVDNRYGSVHGLLQRVQ